MCTWRVVLEHFMRCRPLTWGFGLRAQLLFAQVQTHVLRVLGQMIHSEANERAICNSGMSSSVEMGERHFSRP